MTNRYRHIDRRVVREMLTQWPSARTGGLLAAMGFDKQMVRQEFRKVMKARYGK